MNIKGRIAGSKGTCEERKSSASAISVFKRVEVEVNDQQHS